MTRRGSTGAFLLATMILLILLVGTLTLGQHEINKVVGHTFYCPRLGLYVQVVSLNGRTTPTTYLCRYETGQGPLLRLAEINVTREELTEQKP